MLTGGPGWAVSSRLLGHQVYYVFLDAHLAAGPALGRGHRTALAANAGLLWQWSEAWRLHLEGGATYPLLGDRRGSPFWQVSVGESWSVSDAWALRAEAGRSGEARHAALGVVAYF
jgi:hypothetical protein